MITLPGFTFGVTFGMPLVVHELQLVANVLCSCPLLNTQCRRCAHRADLLPSSWTHCLELPVGLASTALLAPQVADMHCQVPCGIFNDPARVAQLKEDATTIRKAMVQVPDHSHAPSHYPSSNSMCAQVQAAHTQDYFKASTRCALTVFSCAEPLSSEQLRAAALLSSIGTPRQLCRIRPPQCV